MILKWGDEMDLIRVDNGKYDEYENLLLERDHINKRAGQIWTAYQKAFGKLITDLFQAKIECIKRKKMLSYYQKAINRGLPIDQDVMQEWLHGEMIAYQAELNRMLDDYKRAVSSGISTAYEVQRSKELYRRIAKLIHPDINPETDRHEKLIELWNRTSIAYGRNDVKELAEIEVLVRKVMKEIGIGVARTDVPDLDDKIEALKEEIETIKTTKPYTYLYLVEDEEASQEETAKLEKELESYRIYSSELDTRLSAMINEGKVSFQWRMN